MDRFLKKIVKTSKPNQDDKDISSKSTIPGSSDHDYCEAGPSHKESQSTSGIPESLLQEPGPSGSNLINEITVLTTEDDEEMEVDPVADPGQKSRGKPTTTKPAFKRKFSNQWLEDPELKEWISKSKDKISGDDRAYCKICCTNIIPHKTDIRRHLISTKHQKAQRSIAKTKPITEIIQKPEALNVKRAEVKLVGLIATQNLPISLMDILSPLMGNIFPDSKIAQQLAIKRTKATDVLKHSVGEEFGKNLYETLSTPGCFYSLIMDETTDKATIKQCAFTVIFYNEKCNKLSTKFFDMVEMPSGTAEELTKCVKETFMRNHVSLENLVGFSSDTTNVMFGEKLSVVALLKKEFPHVVFVKCSCHSIHLVAAKACAKLPNSIEDVLRHMGSHFSRSYGRQVAFQEFQEFFQVEMMKMLSPSTTRWLSLEACVSRVLSQYPALKAYFTEFVFEDGSKTSDEILQTLQNPFTVIYLEFMCYVLNIFNSFNKLFQSEHPLLHKLKSEVTSLLKTLCSNYIAVNIIKGTDVFALNHNDPSTFVDNNDLYLGVAAYESLQDLKTNLDIAASDFDNFSQTCRDFYIEAVSQIKQRFSFGDPIFSVIDVVDPGIAQSFKTKSLIPIFNKFPSLEKIVDANALDQEWRDHALLDHNELNLSADLYPEDYWGQVSQLKNAAGAPLFRNVTKVMQLLMVLPFSNASVERLFSNLNNIKTFHRNKLKNKTLVSLMLAKEGIEEEGGCISFEPTKTMLLSDKTRKLKP